MGRTDEEVRRIKPVWEWPDHAKEAAIKGGSLDFIWLIKESLKY